MTEKTEERIAAEKEAVQKMVGAKGAMDTTLHRIQRLEDTIRSMNNHLDDIAGKLGDGLLTRTFYVDGNGSGPQTIPLRQQIASIAAKGRAVL